MEQQQQSEFYDTSSNFNSNGTHHLYNQVHNEMLVNTPTLISHGQEPATPTHNSNPLIPHINNASGHLTETVNINSTPPITMSNINLIHQDYPLDPMTVSFPDDPSLQPPSTDNHPIVPSQRTIDQQHLQRKLDEEHERVAAVAQQVMAQQMAHQYAFLQQQQQHMIQAPSHETPHVVLSQLSTNSTPSTPTVHQLQQPDMNALLQQQQQLNQPSYPLKRPTDTVSSLAKKKSRRHTFSNHLNIDTKNLQVTSAPRSAMDYKPPMISLPPRPTPQELGLVESKTKDYESMTKEELIARLIVLENEKLNKATTDEEEDEEDEEESLDTPTDHQQKPDEDKSMVDSGEEEEEEEESVAEEEERKKDVTQIQCKWKACGDIFDELQKLITHINDKHVGSGKPTYCCEWEGCPRNQKPFTKRHKMYNHLRTHTGERPFVCDKPGCGKRFSRPDSLTTHIKTHSNIRPYICLAKGCGKAYYHSRSLKKHEKMHEASNANYNSAPSTVGIPHPHMIPVDYISSHMSMQSESLPNSPHPTLVQQQQQQQATNFLLPSQSKPYTPLVLSYPPPTGLGEPLYDSVNTQQGFQQGFDSMNTSEQTYEQQQQFDSVNQQQRF